MPRGKSNVTNASPLSKMTVKELQAELKKKNLSTSGLKADLIQRLEDANKEIEEEKTNGDHDEERDKENHKEELEEKTEAKSKSKTEKEDEPKPKEEFKVEETNSQVEESKPTPEKTPETTPVESVAKTEPATKDSTTTNPIVPTKVEEEKKLKEVEKTKEEVIPEPVDPQNENEMEVDKEKRKLEEDRELSPTSKRRRWNNNNNNNDINNESVKKQEKETKEEKPKAKEATTSTSTTKAEQQIPERLQKRLNFNTKKPETEVKVDEPVEDIKPEVLPSSFPISNCLIVKNFVRPFTLSAVEEIINKTSTALQFAMDNVRSKCYVVYETKEEGEAARNALHNLMWPPANKSRLEADFATEDEAKRFITQNYNRATPKYQSKNREQKKEEEVPVKTLDDLFLKTTTKPHVYYLPLTDAQVEAKKTGTKVDNNNNSNNNASNNANNNNSQPSDKDKR